MKNLFDVSGKKVLFIGGAGDLGYSMMAALVEAGAYVVAVDIDTDIKAKTEQFKKNGLRADSIIADISNRDEVHFSFDTALGFLGGEIDILVNSAGIQRRYPSEDFPIEEWDKVISINLTSMFLYCQLSAKVMIAKGKGKIINIASMQSFFGGITIPAYAASKGGVAQLTKALSNDWAAKGININAIAPGYMNTKLNTALINDPVRNAEVLSRIPQKRWGTGDDLKGLIIFLASSASDYISGTVIPVDGGYLGR